MQTAQQVLLRLAGWLALAVTAAFGTAHAATITVDSLADDVFPDATGAIFDAGNNPISLASAKCTLRMAIASANLNLAVGGATFGCVAGAPGPDTIVFAASLNLATTPGTITLADKPMSEAPASYTGGNTAGLAIAGPLTITGPGSTKLTLDGILLAATGNRILTVSDGSATNDSPATITGLRFYRGRAVDSSSGCMFASESTTLDDVTFENCESIGGPNNNGFGGALGLGNFNVANGGTYRPTIAISNSAFLGNRAVRGSSPQRSENGGAFIGSGTRMAGAVTLTNVVFNGNSAERHGGLLITDVTSVHISGSHFIGNAATGSTASNATNAAGSGRYGGFAINTVSGNVTIDNFTRVNGNVANEERGGFGVLTVGGTTTIDTVDISGNYVNRGRIGGFEIITDTFDANNNCTGAQLRPVVISNVRIQSNSVATTHGGFRVICSGAVTMTDATIAVNEARGYRLLPTDVVNTAHSAGQFSQATDATAAQSTAVLTRVQVVGNSTSTIGNTTANNVLTVFGLGAFTANGLRVWDNTSDTNFAGLTLNARGAGRNYVVVNSEFSGNKAQNITALYIETDGNYTVRNTTIGGNRATTGGSIVKVNGNTNTTNGIHVAFEHTTIARNTANFEEAIGAGVFANTPNAGVANPTLFDGTNATLTFTNTILGSRAPGYSGSSTLGFDSAHGFNNVTGTYSLLEWTGGAPPTFCAGTGMKCNIGAVIDVLWDNGSDGSGVRTMAVLAGSPAIDAGGPVSPGLTTDARGTGFPRVIGSAVDMGAFEAAPATTYGCSLDADGNGTRDPLTDGLLIVRAMLGMTGTAATAGVIGPSPTRPDWTSIRAYFNANCGTNLAQ